MKAIFVGLTMFGVSSVAAAQHTVLISDIDDTIKTTYVKDSVYASRYLFENENTFKGMSELYSLIKSDVPRTDVFYVTNATNTIGDKYLNFLNFNNFPQGENVNFRSSMFDKGFKLRAIKSIVDKIKPEQLILVGDNGQKDSQVYSQIREYLKGSNTKVYTFIRIAYSSRSTNGLLGTSKEDNLFVSPFEILLGLRNFGVISQGVANDFVGKHFSYLADLATDHESAPQSFAWWQDCFDFKATFAPLAQDIPQIKQWSELVEKVCHSN